MLKRNKALILVVVLTAVLCFFLIIRGSIDLTILQGQDNNIHFNLFTVSSIIGGFMFSGLGLLVSVSGNRLIKEFERARLMNRVYNNILVGIVFCIVTIILSLIMIFKIFAYSVEIVKVISAVEVTALVIGIACFLLSVVDLKFVISTIHQDSKVVPEEVLETLRKQSKIKNNADIDEEKV